MIKGFRSTNSWRKLLYVKPYLRSTNNYGSPDKSCSKCALLWQISMMHIHLNCFLFLRFPLFMHKLWIFQWECLMIRRKIAKGDMTCHSKPNFCFVWTNIIKMVMQSGYSFLKRKIIFAALLIDFFFQKICYLETLILRYVFHRNNIYSRFYDMLSDIWSGTGGTESVKNATDPYCR